MDYNYIDKNKYLIENYLKLGLNEKQLLIILLCIKDDITFVLDYDKLERCMNIKADQITSILSNLFANNTLTVALEKFGNDYREVVDCTHLFNMNIEQSSDINVFSDIERIYGKSLSSKEVEVISKWISINKYEKDKIIEAFGIASLKNISNLNYIEKILENNEVEEEEVKPLNIKYNWLEDE